MTRTVTDVIANLILPPAGPLLVAFAGLLLARRRRRAGVALSVFGLALLWVLSLGVVGDNLLRLLEPPPVAKNELAAVDAIVVPGGGVNEYSPEYAGPVLRADSFQRLRYGARLARETGLPILVSGGSPYGSVAEADVMASTLKRDFGLEARWVENASPTTAENAARSFALLARERKTRIALVTTAWHIPRAKRAFEAAGFSVVAAPTGYVGQTGALQPRDFVPSAEGLHGTRTALWELLGSIWYALRR
jgi:uncharacterized SAM-binding protein YcdF (DUF218 family)